MLARGAAAAAAARPAPLRGGPRARGRARDGPTPREPAPTPRGARGGTPVLRSGRRPRAACGRWRARARGGGRREARGEARGEVVPGRRARALARRPRCGGGRHGRSRHEGAGHGHERGDVGGLCSRGRAACLATGARRGRGRQRAGRGAERGGTPRARAGEAHHGRLQPGATEAAALCIRKLQPLASPLQVLYWRDMRAHRAASPSRSPAEPSLLSLAEFIQVLPRLCTPAAALCTPAAARLHACTPPAERRSEHSPCVATLG